MPQEDKRNHILECARYCFMNFGYKTTTMDLIAKTAKMGKGTFYNYFKTKEEVFRCVIQRDLESFSMFAKNSIKGDIVDEEALLHYMKKSLTKMKSGDMFLKLQMEAATMGTPEVEQALKTAEVIAFEQLKFLVTQFAKYKGIKDCDVELTTFLLLELFSALVYRWPQNHEPLSDQRIEDVFMKLYPMV